MGKRPLNSNKGFTVIKGGNQNKKLLSNKAMKIIIFSVVSTVLFFIAIRGINTVRDYLTARMLQIEYVDVNSMNEGIYGTGLYIRDEKVIESYGNVELTGKLPQLSRVRKGQSLGKQGGNEVIAPVSGLVLYYTDDYEQISLGTNVEDIAVLDFFNYEEYQVMEVSQNPNSGDKLLKIVNNYHTEIIVRLDVAEAGQLWDLDRVRVKLEAGDNSLVKWVDIKGTATHGDYTYVHLFSDGITDDFIDVRFSNVFFILDTITGIKLPEDAIVSDQGKTGIYSLSRNRVVFREVVPMKEEGGYVWVTGLSEKQGVILNPKIVKIGQRIKF